MISIRHAEEKDLPQMLEIYNDVILNTTAVYDYEPHTLEMRRQWFETKKEQGFPVIVAEENEVLVGFSSFGPFRNWAAYKYSVENSVYVKNDQHTLRAGQGSSSVVRNLQRHHSNNNCCVRVQTAYFGNAKAVV